MSLYNCQTCGGAFRAREADRKRGWARFCSKRCKAIRQSQTRPDCASRREDDEADYANEAGWDGHKAEAGL